MYAEVDAKPAAALMEASHVERPFHTWLRCTLALSRCRWTSWSLIWGCLLWCQPVLPFAWPKSRLWHPSLEPFFLACLRGFLHTQAGQRWRPGFFFGGGPVGAYLCTLFVQFVIWHCFICVRITKWNVNKSASHFHTQKVEYYHLLFFADFDCVNIKYILQYFFLTSKKEILCKLVKHPPTSVCVKRF